MRTVLVRAIVALGLVRAACADVTVQSVGTASVKPDVALLAMSVSQKGVDASQLEDAVRRRARQLADQVSKLSGVRRCDVKRSDFSLDRPSVPDGTVPAPTVFESTFLVLVHAAPEQKLVLNVMALGLSHGAALRGESLPSGQGEACPVYGVTKAEDAYAEAFSDALKKARGRAKSVADRAGLKLGGVKSVVEEERFGGFNEFGWRRSAVFCPFEFAGPFHDAVEISIKFKITFEVR
jgi:hypothetical protein